MVNFPEIELELMHGTLGGVFTTVEGLIEKIAAHFANDNPFIDSDSEFAARIANLVDQLNRMRAGGIEFTLILSDPLSQSFVSNPYHPDADPALTMSFRPRTFDENEDLGINDMKTENYN